MSDRNVAADEQMISQIITRAGSSTYENWWSRVTTAGYCTSPIHLTRSSSDGDMLVFVRCKNRRATVCPSCSDLYAGDTWHLVHAGLGGGHDIPPSVAEHPAVFATLTAPSFGPVHGVRKDSAGRPRPCHPPDSNRCAHGRAFSCSRIHEDTDPTIGQPLCGDCYEYPSHVLFTWHAPELWARFAITLRRLVRRELITHTEPAGKVRVSFVKIVEMQRRGIPHFHAVIRLDDADSDQVPLRPVTAITAETLAVLVRRAATTAYLDVAGIGGELITLRFGTQIDTQLLSLSQPEFDASTEDDKEQGDKRQQARRVAGYLAKYVTKSVAEFGLAPRRIPAHIIDSLPVTGHVKSLLYAITELAAEPEREEMLHWLHTLGYRGHVTTKSRRYSVTMGALRAHRAAYQDQHNERTQTEDPNQTTDFQETSESETTTTDDAAWVFKKSGHATAGDHLLAISAAIRERESRWAARQLVDATERGEER